jgi:hypothetical protein
MLGDQPDSAAVDPNPLYAYPRPTLRQFLRLSDFSD